jgi:DNA-binding CsgD family transcriptional regulator
MSFSTVRMATDRMAKEAAIAPFKQDSAQRDADWLRSIVEHWTDGVLIVSTSGEWVYANAVAYQICHQLSTEKAPAETVPAAVWQVCQLLLSTQQMGNSPVVLESEVVLKSTSHYRVRVQWLHLEDLSHPYLLITLEDCYLAMQSRAIAETQRYQLTPRQAEVWLLYRTGHTYRDIATSLFVTLNTVKRHMKDIYVKQKNHM